MFRAFTLRHCKRPEWILVCVANVFVMLTTTRWFYFRQHAIRLIPNRISTTHRRNEEANLGSFEQQIDDVSDAFSEGNKQTEGSVFKKDSSIRLYSIEFMKEILHKSTNCFTLIFEIRLHKNFVFKTYRQERIWSYTSNRFKNIEIYNKI